MAPILGQRLAEQQPGILLPQTARKAIEVQEAHRQSFRMAVESGVRIAMGSDTGVGPHGTNVEELRLMVENGMTPMEAIVASTKTASECIHLDHETGKLADLLVVEGNSSDDVTLLEDKSKLLMIMQGGRTHKDLIGGD